MTEDEQDGSRGLMGWIKNAALRPFRLVFSPPAQRAYLATALVLISASALFALAIAAYTLFYWSYIPRIAFRRPVHLQFDPGPAAADSGGGGAPHHPYGTISVADELVSAQRYDVTIELDLPRTRANREAGNFMVSATMFAAGTVMDAFKEGLAPGLAAEDNKLAESRRAAMLVYRSPAVEYLWKLTEVHWYLLGLRREAERITVAVFDGVEFAQGWRNVPATMRVEVQSGRRMQIYSAEAVFKARFRGLRWLMYNHRIVSAVFFISAFWTTEMLFAGLAWAGLAYVATQRGSQAAEEADARSRQRIKQEDNEEEEEGEEEEGQGGDEPSLSGTERTFPTTSKQRPLRYESPKIKEVKEEEGDDSAAALPGLASRTTEADDEGDDASSFHDSGLGTSLESSGGARDAVRRRRSRIGLLGGTSKS